MPEPIDNRHPNRGWRKRLESASDQWLESDEAIELAKPGRDAVERRAKIKAAYMLGFAAGRASVQRPPPRGQRSDINVDAERLRELLAGVTDQAKRVAIAYEHFGRYGGDVLAHLEGVADVHELIARRSPKR